jgi:hypothetical protein
MLRTELPSSAIAMPSRLSKNQMLLRVAWATPPALRTFQLTPPSVLSQALPNTSARTKRWALNGRKPVSPVTPSGRVRPAGAPLSRCCTVSPLTAMTVVGSASRKVKKLPLLGDCTVCHEAPPSAVRRSVRRVTKVVGSEGSNPDSKPMTSACRASTNSMSSE